MAICLNKLVLAILGVGGVGKCFIKQLAPVSSRFNVTLLYVSTSTKAIYNHNHNPINIDTALEDLSASPQQPLPIPDLVKWLKSVQSAAVIIDNTSSQHIADHYPLILKDGIHIITPNKKAFSGPHELWHHINVASATSGSYVYHEATVGAGLPIISTLKELVETGDSIVKIEGIFSGTMSFLFNSFSRAQGNGGKWSEEVKKAQQLGYTEPDPRDDLNGLDVARKLTILARLAGLTVQSPASFPVESLIPNDLKSCATAHEFLDKLGKFDDAMEEVKNAASSNGKVVRYTGKIDFSTGSLNVGLGQFDYSHPFSSLKGSDNMISFYTKRYGDTPLTIQGAGAGGEVTAMGVTGELLKLLARCPDAISKTV